jgi:hypothetical protein
VKNGYLWGSCILWWTGDREGNLNDNFLPILFSHEKGLAETSLKLLNRFNRWEWPTNRCGYRAKLVDVESNKSAIASMGFIDEKTAIRISE